MTIVGDDHKWRHNLEHQVTTLPKARIINYDCNCSFIVLATVITIVNYDRKTFIVQATGQTVKKIQVSLRLGQLNFT